MTPDQRHELVIAELRAEGRANRKEIKALRDDLARVLGLVQELHAFWLRFAPQHLNGQEGGDDAQRAGLARRTGVPPKPPRVSG